MGLLIENCSIGERKHASVLVEGALISRISQETTPDVPAGTIKLDAGGSTLLPGLVDSHCHPFEFGWLKRSVDLRGTSNVTGIRLRLFAKIQRAQPGEWIRGKGWDQEAFPEARMPSRVDIDDLSPRNPVALSRVCGHIVLLNTVAIETLSLDGIQGSEYERDSSGRLTGILKEGAQEKVFARIPRSSQDCVADLLSAEGEAAKFGLTTLHTIVSADSYASELEAIVSLLSAGALSLRHRLYIPAEALGYVAEKRIREKLDDDQVRINGVKIYADGSLGARTAALREPYSDDPGNTGILRHTAEELDGLVESADNGGYQVIIHAIGDRAVEQAIGSLTRVAGKGNPRRHRIEHASLLPKDLRVRMARAGIRATVQPLFITSDTWALKRLGEERVRYLYPLKSMLGEGIVASGSSDAPVESMSPMVGAWAAMARGGLAPEESLSLEEAVRIYTANGVSNGFDDPCPGLAEGMGANLTLLDSDIEGMHPAMVRKVGVAATVVGGILVYSYLGSEN
ncbi:MAG: amidohydrolase family protein [Thaumarchaeota archaeon]|nr:amidohydrolase family protein [Nitrososphaerota archaeon]